MKRFANRKVREALRYLIDYKGLDQAVMPYYGKLHQRPLSSGFMGSLPDQGYTLDIPKAKALLAEAGYPNGFQTTLRVLSKIRSSRRLPRSRIRLRRPYQGRPDQRLR